MAENPTKSIMTWGIGLGSLALFGLVMLILFGNLVPSSLVPNRISGPITVTNETIAWLNISGYSPVGLNSTWVGVTPTTIWAAYPNASAGYNYTINIANATVNGSGMIFNATAVFNATAMNNLSISYTYGISYAPSAQNQIVAYNGNYTQSLVNTSTQFPTVGTILGVALLLIILVAILVFAVKKMSGVTMGTGNSGNGGQFAQGDFG